MTAALPRIESAGLDGWMIRLFDAIDEANMPWLTALVRRCEASFGDALVDLVPSYTTLLVVFDPLAMAPEEARRRLVELLADLQPDATCDEAAPRELPTWYDPSVGPELERLAERGDMSVEQVIERHSQVEYRVFALGFAPGFAFMGRVDERIACPRLETPRRRVPKGSVAIVERQTSAYPLESPGGWNLIGRTPAVLFDRHREGFSLLAVGDRVRFVPVSRAEFERLGGDVRSVEASQ
ncbi:5-oxoprolinase subunit B family protein [Halomonas caseinilytica]|uniref:5-oxoprolinase subunit B family protein n=1 Tax=Halomonas caseinilytica TaxID=438744 RepID=UPI0007E5A902|nr:allophanate hydrolase subunit 1 [Halomonas caseinilytica]SEM44509.1 sensor histidine kinase inhibitor, KipI family [Halomonas caseinilytica]